MAQRIDREVTAAGRLFSVRAKDAWKQQSSEPRVKREKSGACGETESAYVARGGPKELLVGTRATEHGQAEGTA
jgi:hypothetical protein